MLHRMSIRFVWVTMIGVNVQQYLARHEFKNFRLDA